MSTPTVTQTRSCTSCRGTGTSVGRVPGGRWMHTDCSDCEGIGTVVTVRRRDPRRPRTRIGRAIRKLLGQWWVWTTYMGAIIGVAIWGLFAPPAAADEMIWTFSAPAIEYVAEHGEEICLDLDGSTPAQVGELIHKLMWLGDLTEQQANEALGFSALSICPINLELLDAYAEHALVVT